MIGQIINGYRITEEIKSGGMATVYKGVNAAGFAKAFKVVRPDKAENNPALYRRFLKEIDVLRLLDEHPNIVRAENVHNHNNTTILEMEFLDGSDFDDYIKKHAPNGIKDKEQLAVVCKQILEVLRFAHDKKILHLDIKPSNIFRTRNGYIKLLDFGIAQVVGDEAEKIQGAAKVTMTVSGTNESTFRGTLAYSSPEQQAGTVLSETSDIFSFGKTLHYIATGSEDMDVDVTIEPFASIVKKCTEQKRKERFQTCKEVIDFIDKPSGGEKTKCISCKRQIDANVRFCPYCGAEQKETPSSPPPPPPPPTGKKCPKCNRQYSISDNYCNYCSPATRLISR